MGAARVLPAELLPRLGLLLPLLASDQGGEVISTAAAVTRLLKSVGCDWHDVVARLLNPPLANPKEPRSAPPRADYDSSQAISAPYIAELIDQIMDSHCYLSSSAQKFLRQLQAKTRSHSVIFFTPRQWQWFVALLEEAKAVRR